jgi:hypothetical protein
MVVQKKKKKKRKKGMYCITLPCNMSLSLCHCVQYVTALNKCTLYLLKVPATFVIVNLGKKASVFISI